MLKMLRRLIREDINLSWMPGRDLWKVKIDRSQVDQILANLLLNARDAITDKGKVTIETENVELDEVYCAGHPGFVPGRFVMLAVSDDGCGMDREILAHLYEPFFTTKGVGQGTGLGLATVYGIVKQNSGFINVYSESGKGTIFRIYLPCCAIKNVPAVTDGSTRAQEGGTETILLVEDEPMILELSKDLLEELGYTVLAARTPGEAIRLAEEYAGEIQLLMTDVIMPEMNGWDLAKRLLSRYPDLRSLFMSGYTASTISKRGALEEDVHFMQKPFSMSVLSAKVRDALERYR
jgi:CheY-like chemotaxis protein